ARARPPQREYGVPAAARGRDGRQLTRRPVVVSRIIDARRISAKVPGGGMAARFAEKLHALGAVRIGSMARRARLSNRPVPGGTG
ncbi:MAG TPA: hypothetical protein VHN80_32965, partial [Kineosporiaceae bacterium]|nr:hypothetical protein [Kineosporiaceae bacterium]